MISVFPSGTRRWKHQELVGNIELQLRRGTLCADRFRGQAGSWGEEEMAGRGEEEMAGRAAGSKERAEVWGHSQQIL